MESVTNYVLRAIIAAAAVWVADYFLPGITVDSADVWWQQVLIYLLVGAVLAALQAIVKPLIKVLTFPLYLLTLGLFGLVVNALLLMLCSWITSFLDWGLQVAEFWPAAMIGGFIISITSGIAAWLLTPARNATSGKD